jgi:hypothetical protein
MANLAICSNQIADRFDCLSFTLEMPFKDTTMLPDHVQGWSIERSIHLGSSILVPIAAVMHQLRN